MRREASEQEDPSLVEDPLEALKLVEAALAKNPKNVGFLKQKAALIQLVPRSGSTLKSAEKCLLRAHQLAPRNLDVINDLVRLYDKVLENPAQKEYFQNLFVSIVDRMMGVND